MSEQLGHSAISSPFSSASYMERIISSEQESESGLDRVFPHLSYLKLVSTGAGIVVGLRLRIILKIFDLYFIMKHRHRRQRTSMRGYS